MALLQDRDYTLIIDRSGSMVTRDTPTGQQRWQAVQESTLALARKCEEFDPDGITVYFFSTNFQRFDSVTSERVGQLFASNAPDGYTNLAPVLQHAFDSYFERKAKGQTKKMGELILVITDGAPSDPEEVVQAIIKTTHRMERDEELALSFVQIGRDADASAFLRRLDDELVGDPNEKPGFFQRLFGGASKPKARFDICDTVTFDQLEDRPLTQVLLSAIND